ncbi:MAG: amidohydrolase family protein [Actinomycetia bacterium]|nr:amidohydrolase family protein [Actinomycetes bacterium]MCP4957764.1 amidohydrolase family protein [Actinomycetes bacterium]
MRTIVQNGTLLDTSTMTFTDGVVVIDDGQIVEVSERYAGPADVTIDAAGRYVLPGLIDGHVHFRLSTFDFGSLVQWSEVEFGIVMADLARATVQRGFTTVRDLGGDVTGLIRAIQRGSTVGPRIVRAGLMLTQTGGHGDAMSGERDVPLCGCALGSDRLSIIADGAEAVRKGARHLLRDGSDFLKIHVSGGVASPSDPLDSIQYTHDEIDAAVTEASHRGTYVTCHGYTSEAVQMAVRAGVGCVEHGNLVDADTAKLMADSDVTLVPTLVTYKAMNDLGATMGLPQANLDKNAVIFASGLSSLETARSAGVTMGFGTDLIGESQPMQNLELAIRAEVQPAEEVLHSMWTVNAKLCHMEGQIGVITPEARGDLVISNVNPLDDLVAFADHETALSHVVQGGRVVVDRT